MMSSNKHDRSVSYTLEPFFKAGISLDSRVRGIENDDWSVVFSLAIVSEVSLETSISPTMNVIKNTTRF